MAVRAPRRTVLVFCEGKRTEPEYLKALKRERAVRDVPSVDIRISEENSGFAPLSLVTAAAAAHERLIDEKGEVDEVWWLFHVEWPDNHPNLHDAIALAKAKDVRVAISNPCFELWLALQLGDQTAWLDTRDAIRLRRSRHGSSGKGLDGPTCMTRRDHAARRARSLDAEHRRADRDVPDDVGQFQWSLHGEGSGLPSSSCLVGAKRRTASAKAVLE